MVPSARYVQLLPDSETLTRLSDRAEYARISALARAAACFGLAQKGAWTPASTALFVIARNQAIDELRKRSRVELSDDVDRLRRQEITPDPDLSALTWVSDQELVMLIERLPLAQRQVLMLRYMLDLSHAEVAEVLGRSNEDVRNLQSRGLAFIRTRLTALGRAPSRQKARLVRYPKKARVLRSRRFALIDT